METPHKQGPQFSSMKIDARVSRLRSDAIQSDPQFKHREPEQKSGFSSRRAKRKTQDTVQTPIGTHRSSCDHKDLFFDYCNIVKNERILPLNFFFFFFKVLQVRIIFLFQICLERLDDKKLVSILSNILNWMRIYISFA